MDYSSATMASYQSKRWTWRYYFNECSAAVSILRNELSAWIKRVRVRLFTKEQTPSCAEQLKSDEPLYHLTRQGPDRVTRGQQLGSTRQHHVNAPALSASSLSSSSVVLAQRRRQPPVSHCVLPPGTSERDDYDSQPTTLKYGIVILSKLTNLSGLWIPSFTLDIHFGLMPSRLFVMTNYFLSVLFIVIGLLVTKFVIGPSLEFLLRKMVSKSLAQFININISICGAAYIFYGLFNAIYIQYQRHFIADFFLYRCSMITLPRRYQRRKIVKLYVILYIFAYFSEPLYALLSLYYDIEQPRLWASLSRFTFLIVKGLTLVITAASASLVSSLGIIISLMSCYLMLAIAKHLERTFHKQSVRFQHRRSHMRRPQRAAKHLEDLLDDRTRKLIRDYSCDTLTMDWPELGQPPDNSKGGGGVLCTPQPNAPPPSSSSSSKSSSSRFASSSNCSSTSSFSSTCDYEKLLVHQKVRMKTKDKLPPIVNQTTSRVAYRKQQHANEWDMSTGGLLFLYKNLLKNMSELKHIIRMFESKFGNFHFVHTLVTCLFVAMLIATAFTEARERLGGTARNSQLVSSTQTPPPSSKNKFAQALENAGLNSSTSYITPFVGRIIGFVLTFIVSNIYVMLWCDCLSHQIIIIKSQLFKMNIDLTRALLSADKRRLLTQNQQVKRSPCTPENNAQAAPTSISGSWADIDQIWSLYDQVERLGSSTLFKFSSDSYYTKRCLLVIFGRAVSILILSIQIIEVYSYA